LIEEHQDGIRDAWRNISQVEVTNVSKHGFWLLLDDEELFLPFTEFPWFKDASIGKLLNVERLRPHHLYWPGLDVDLAVRVDSPPRTVPPQKIP
jgi:hypothetical protein